MARIRTIKPELWTDPEFVECSTNARLLFVAALNFASDYGVMADKPVQLKMQCFPGDDISIGPLIEELIVHGFWVRRTAPDGANVLVIRTFLAHQRVDKPQAGRWGNPTDWPPFVEPSPTVPRTFHEPSSTEGKGREWKGREGKGTNTVADKSAQSAGFAEFYELFPTKRSRGTAEKAYASAMKRIDHAALMAGLEANLAHIRSQVARGFCQLPASWLNADGWADQPPSPVTARPVNGKQAGAFAKIAEIQARNQQPNTPIEASAR